MAYLWQRLFASNIAVILTDSSESVWLHGLFKAQVPGWRFGELNVAENIYLVSMSDEGLNHNRTMVLTSRPESYAVALYTPSANLTVGNSSARVAIFARLVDPSTTGLAITVAARKPTVRNLIKAILDSEIFTPEDNTEIARPRK